MMKNVITLCTLMFTFLSFGFSQIEILFVDDSTDDFENSALLFSAIDASGYTAAYYSIADSTSGPIEPYMSQFDLVIWHTSTQSEELNLWSGTDQDNEELMYYLDDGGSLWLIGNDFLFDRYGPAPMSFTETEFPNQYFGIESLDAQAYADDGGLGVPEVNPTMGSPISDLNDLSWQFATLWWADAVTPVQDAQAVYQMGDSEYVLYESPCAVYHENGDSKVLTYLFDLSLAGSTDMIEQNTATVLDFFNQLVFNTNDISTSETELQLYPNPTNSELNISFDTATVSSASIEIYNLMGVLVYTEELQENTNQLLDISGLSSGSYLCTLVNNGQRSESNILIVE